MNAPQLVLAWLVLAHLTADFVLQTETIATTKFGRDRAAWRALLTHVGVVGVVNIPVALVFGLRGLAYLAVTVATHLVIDRVKIVLTLRAEPLPAAEDGDPALDRRWTPLPGAWFAADQLAHLAILGLAWLACLSTASPLSWWSDAWSDLLGSVDPDAFHRAVLAGVVLADLLIVNVRAGQLFVGTLVRAPRAPLVPAGTGDGPPSPARLGATIGILERLLICALVLGNGLFAIGLVVTAKTLARFKQLDDREFAEYYLLGTLASVTLAVVTALVAQLALG